MRGYREIGVIGHFSLWSVALALVLAVAGCSRRLARAEHGADSALGAFFQIHQGYLSSGAWPAGRIDSAIAQYPEEGVFHYQRGRMLSEKGQYVEAVASFERACALDSTNTVYLMAYGEALARTDAPGDSTSLRLARRLVLLQERKPEAWYRLALEYFRLHQPDSVIAICRQQGALLAPYYSVNLLLASAYHQQGNCDSMYHYAQRAVGRGEQLDNALYISAQAAMMCNRVPELVEAFERAASMVPPEVSTWRFYTDYLCRRGYEREAVRTFLNISEQYPEKEENTLEVLSLLLYAARGSTLGGAEYASGFERVFRGLSPTRPALVVQYRFYMVTKQPMRGYEPVRQLSDTEPSAYYLWNLRKQIELVQLGDSASGVVERLGATLRFMSMAFPFDASSVLQYTYLQRQSGVPLAGQVDTLNLYIARYESLLRGAGRREVYAVRTDDSSGVEMGKRESLRRSLSSLYGTRGDLEAEGMKLERAWTSYEKALRLDTANAVACNNYAYSLAQQGRDRLAYARRLSERSLRYEPRNVSYLDTYGYILYLEGRYEEARVAFVRLLAIESNPGRTALAHYSDVLRALGNSASAELYRMRAVESSRP